MPLKPNHLEILSNNLKLIRLERGETQRAFARECGMSFRLYQRLEAGHSNPTLKSLARLAERLRINVSELLTLKRVRIETGQDEFLTIFKNQFEGRPYSVGIRTIEGVALWANHEARKITGIRLENFPYSYSENLPKDSYDVYLKQNTSERLGYVEPYINFQRDSDGHAIYFRCYPVLIYIQNERSPKLIAIYSAELSSTPPDIHFDFATGLIDCLRQISPKPELKKVPA